MNVAIPDLEGAFPAIAAVQSGAKQRIVGDEAAHHLLRREHRRGWQDPAI
ncbi:MAG: hypothetical protein RL077_4221 [Verrucomicrobiota bacterium]